jgi:hypothetical protein
MRPRASAEPSIAGTTTPSVTQPSTRLTITVSVPNAADSATAHV